MFTLPHRDTLIAYGYNTPGMDASLRYLPIESKLRSSIVEDNVQKTSFFLLLGETRCKHEVAVSDALSKHGIQYVLTHPSQWVTGSMDKISANREKMQVSTSERNGKVHFSIAE